MRLERADTQRAYARIREKIITLELPPGSLIHEEELSDELELGRVPVEEALKLLLHDNLVVQTPQMGLTVTGLDLQDLDQISEIRLLLEGFSAAQAAMRAQPDDLVVLRALRREQAEIPPEESGRLFDLDHKFHQAVARAAHNSYLAQTLEHYFGLSQRMWHLVLPHLDFLPAAVEKHRDLVEAIEAGDAGRSEQIMRDHIQEFYDRVRAVLADPRD